MKRRPEPAGPSAASLRDGLLAGLLSLLPALAGAEQTIAYEPAITTLSGTLRGGAFVHPSGQRVPFWYLQVREPVRVAADPHNPVNAAAAGVKELQVYPGNAALVRRLQRQVGRRVLVQGAVFHEHTAWHVRTLVMVASSVQEGGTP